MNRFIPNAASRSQQCGAGLARAIFLTIHRSFAEPYATVCAQDDLQPSTSGRDLDRYQSTSANTAGQRKKRSSELDQLLAASNTHQQFRAPLPKPAFSSQAAKRSLQPEASLNITQAAAFAGAAAAVTAQQHWRDSYDDVSHLFRPDGTFKLPGGCRRSRSKRRRLATAEAEQEAAAPAAAGPDMLARSALSTEEEEEGEVVMSQQQQQQQQERAPSPAPEAQPEPAPAALTEAMAAAEAAEAPAEAAAATVRHRTPDAEEEADRPMKTPRIGSCTDVHAASAALAETTAEAMTAAPEEPPATAQAAAHSEDAPVQDATPEAAAETEAGADAGAEANAEAEAEAGAEAEAEAEVHAGAEAKASTEAEAEAEADVDTAMAEADAEVEAAPASEALARVAESAQQVVLALASTSGTSGDGDVSMVSQDSSSPDRVANTKVSPLTKPLLPASPSSPLQAADVFDKGQASD